MTHNLYLFFKVVRKLFSKKEDKISRRHTRYHMYELPHSLRGFYLTLNDETRIKAMTMDASLSGIGLLITVNKEKIEGHTKVVLLQDIGKHFTLQAKIVYQDKKNLTWKVGVKIEENKMWEKYIQYLLDNVSLNK